MEPFEYVSVLTSLILGLGITQLLTGVADLILSHKKIKFFIPHSLWVLNVFGFQIQEWWYNYEYSRRIGIWHMSDFFFLVTYPIILFVMARLMFPVTLEGGGVDLKSFYFKNFRKIFFVAVFLPIISIPQNIIISGRSFIDELPKVGFGLILLYATISGTENKYFHYAFSIIGIVIALSYLLFYDPAL